MTVHYSQQLASSYRDHLAHLQDQFHLPFTKAVLPALKKTFAHYLPSHLSLVSGHLCQDGILSPFLEMIICSSRSRFHEKEGDWALLEANEALGIMYLSKEEDMGQLQAFFTHVTDQQVQGLPFWNLEVLQQDAEHAFQEIWHRIQEELPEEMLQQELREKALVADKRASKASEHMSSFSGISIPLKEPIKRNPSYSNSLPEGEKVTGFHPGTPSDLTGNYPIHESILGGDAVAVSEYLQQGGNTELKNKNGDTLLHLACEENQLDIAELLLIADADVNSRNHVYEAPLHKAVKEGNEDLLKLLIKFGAELEARNNRGKTSLHIAAIHGRLKTARMLLDHHADIHACMEKGMLPLHLAAWYGQAEIAQMLIQLGADLNALNEDGNSSLHFAAFNGQVRVIKVLMRNGANPSVQNKAGETYLQGINEGYSGEMIRVLD